MEKKPITPLNFIISASKNIFKYLPHIDSEDERLFYSNKVVYDSYIKHSKSTYTKKYFLNFIKKSDILCKIDVKYYGIVNGADCRLYGKTGFSFKNPKSKSKPEICDYKPENNLNVTSGNVTAYFGNLMQSLLELTSKSDKIFAFVSILNNKDLLLKMKDIKYGSSVIIQKEKVFNKNSKKGKGYYSFLKKMYTDIQKNSETGVWCIEFANKDFHGIKSSQIINNDFVIFCHLVDSENLVPYSVWIGPCNIRKWEEGSVNKNIYQNALYIEDDKIAHKYYEIWTILRDNSDDIDWSNTPSARI